MIYTRYVSLSRVLMLCLLLSMVLGSTFAQNTAVLQTATLDVETPAPTGVRERSPEEEVERQVLREQADEVLQQQESSVEQRLIRTYASIPGLQDVSVQVEGAVVILSGTATRALREDAANLAREMDGVFYVVNKIELDADLDVTISPAIARLQQYLRDAVSFFPAFVIGVLIVALFGFFSQLVRKSNWLFDRLSVSGLLSSMIRQLASTALLVVGLLLALDLMGATALVGAVLGTAGVVGLALGFAFRDIVENYLSGILLSIRQPFSIRDNVRIGTYEGVIVRMTSRDMILVTSDGNHLCIPNATVFNSVITNFTRNPRRSFSVDVGVDVSEDLQMVQDVGINAIRMLPGVLQDPMPSARIRSLGDSNILITYTAWIDQQEADFGKVHSNAILVLKQALDDKEVLMPEPTYNIRLKQVDNFTLHSPTQKKSLQSLEETVKTLDTTVDTSLKNQIEEDINDTEEENLLEPEKEKTLPNA
ncbi:mechanosensitive ion channel domain-containing protein [Nitrosomonas sp. ANs5]|uniref:mechanosensitive ion channel family protein n=1 Tax=Nitrosomonas sp. ANs5 TaxID=3423941 RepID=UPI003D347084